MSSKQDHIRKIASPDVNIDDDKTFNEVIVPGLNYEMEIKKVHFPAIKSPFQEIQVVDTCFGKTLLLDGLTQSAQADEFIYTESLVHPALVLCAQRRKQQQQQQRLAMEDGGEQTGTTTEDNSSSTQSQPRLTVLIGGGGELATAAEVLKYPCVEKVVMVEIDEKVVDVCRQYFPEWGGDAVYNDPRFELIIGDAYEYVANPPQCTDKGDITPLLFDAMIMDICDPVEGGPGIGLYTKEFYELASKRLKPSGVIVTHSGMAETVPAVTRTTMNCHYGIWSSQEKNDDNNDKPTPDERAPNAQNSANEDVSLFGPLLNTMQSVFDVSMGYAANMPSFGSEWAFAIAFNHMDQDPKSAQQFDPSSPIFDPELIDEWLEELLPGVKTGASSTNGKPVRFGGLRHYDGTTHCRMFLLSKPLRNYLQAETRTMTKDNMLYLYNG